MDVKSMNGDTFKEALEALVKIEDAQADASKTFLILVVTDHIPAENKFSYRLTANGEHALLLSTMSAIAQKLQDDLRLRTMPAANVKPS